MGCSNEFNVGVQSNALFFKARPEDEDSLKQVRRRNLLGNKRLRRERARPHTSRLSSIKAWGASLEVSPKLDPLRSRGASRSNLRSSRPYRSENGREAEFEFRSGRWQLPPKALGMTVFGDTIHQLGGIP